MPAPGSATLRQAEHPDPIRIYVACLAAYNNGILHGRWIDADQDAAAIRSEIAAMLRASPIPDAEEFAIHDHDGFEGAGPSEYAGTDDVAALAAFIAVHGRLGAGVLEHFGGDLADAQAAFEDYAGRYTSLGDFAAQLTEDTGTSIPDSIAAYVDYDAMGRDLDLGGDIITIQLGLDDVHIFWAR